MKTKSKKNDRFADMVARAGDLPTTVLASGGPLPASESSIASARRLVGGLPGPSSAARVDRLARKLDVLRQLDREQQNALTPARPSEETPERCTG